MPSFSGLRATILIQLLFLIIAAMLLVNVVMVKFSEKDLMQAKVRTGYLMIRAVEQNVAHALISKTRPIRELSSDIGFTKDLNRLLENEEFSELLIIDQNGKDLFRGGPSKRTDMRGVSFARESMANGMGNVHYSGSTWGVLWLNYRTMTISAPLIREGKTIGGIAITASLAPIYERMRNSEKVVLFYILLDTVILAIVGIYILSRTVIRPIHKLLAMTEEYKDGYVIPSFPDISKNEIGNLSRSLSNMLKRLDENKKELQDHISSLEKANIELKQAQDEIIRSEKLASVGRLSAGVAHEIGNPIGIILGYLDLIKKGNIDEDEKADFLDRVESEIARVNLIIKQLLDFSRSSSGKPEKAHTHELVMRAVDIMRPQPMMEQIHVRFELNALNDHIFVDPNYLQQVFLNIIMNAADALMDKAIPGSENDDKALIIESKNIGQFIEIRIVDNGPGMPKEALDHIFDPFYTTKEPGRGTGLGLSVSYRIIESYRGTISAESRMGEGTTIIIKLPIYNRQDEHGEEV